MTMMGNLELCEGALVRAYSRRLATVVSVSGEIGTGNEERLAARVSRHVLDEAIVLDLGGLTAVSEQGRHLVERVQEVCRAAGVDFAVVAADDVAATMNLEDAAYPVVRSVPDALRCFADFTGARRQVLLPLLGQTA
jgi:anti-anti-sigma regulatory factor